MKILYVATVVKTHIMEFHIPYLKMLKEMGWETAVAARNDYDETVIIDHIGNPEVAKIVGDFIHCTNIKDENELEEVGESSSEANVDFTIILGKDFNGRYVISGRKVSK